MAGYEIVNSIFLTVFFGVLFVLFMVCFSYWAIYKKAGEEGWKAFIPIYSQLILCDICNISRMWIAGLIGVSILDGMLDLTSITKLAAFCFNAITSYKLAINFGKSAFFAVGIMFFPFIFLPILAFGSAEYEGKVNYASTTPSINNIPEANPANVSQEIKFCRNCGTEFKEGEIFCPKCGSKRN